MAQEYVVPAWKKDGFHCPHCGVYAHQKWDEVYTFSREKFTHLECSICQKCHQYAIWVEGEIVYPAVSVAPLPSEDMPEDIQKDFSEARSIVNLSPRAAAALLRLSLQKLMRDLGEKGNNLNEDVASLVKKGLPEKIQKALDSVRVIGNNAVHPGQIDLKDNKTIAIALFELINIVIENTITQQKKVEVIFNKIPASAKEQIKKRNRTP